MYKLNLPLKEDIPCLNMTTPLSVKNYLKSFPLSFLHI